MDRDDSNSGFEMLSSQGRKESFSMVPEDTVFRFKISDSYKTKKFGYKLKEGVELPCVKEVGGYKLHVNVFLEPDIEGFDREIDESGLEKMWIMTKKSDQDDSSFVEEDEENKINDDAVNSKEIQSSFNPFKCPVCGELSEHEVNIKNHIECCHPEWKKGEQGSSSGVRIQSSFGTLSEATMPIDLDITEEAEEASNVEKKDNIVSTPHLNPDWLKDLKLNFYSLVVEPCSKKVVDAVNANQKFEKVADTREVRLALIHRTVDYLQEVHGGVTKPRLSEMREVAHELRYIYSAMFKDENVKGYGLGGDKGPDGLALQMLDIFRNRVGGSRSKKSLEADGEKPEKKKGKRKYKYGVDNDKWYEEVSGSVAVPGAAKLARATEALEFEEREKVFDENRKTLMSQFRTSKKTIGNVCRGFFSDYRHLENMFKYLAKISLTDAMEKNFNQQINYLETYLRESIQTAEFAQFLENAEIKCDVFKWICILRRAGDHFDKDGSFFMMLETDGLPAHDGPFIRAVNVEKAFIFELWADKARLISNLSIIQALSSFLHLAFVFDLQYPKECQTICDIVQRRFAGYGDKTGTRTHIKKETAMSKIDKYLKELGKILTGSQ